MKKVILKKDLLLDIRDKKAGKKGVLLVKQDSVGGHIITLAGNNVGDVTIDLSPNVTTELTYVIDDEKVYWQCNVLNPALPDVAPMAINDLQIEYVNTTDVKIKWSAPVADVNRPNLKATAYYLVCSEVMLTSNLPTSQMLQMPNTRLKIKPKASGQEEVFLMKNLLPSKRYFINVISENLVQGKVLKSLPSNIEAFFTPHDTMETNAVPSLIPLYDTSDKAYSFFPMPFTEKPSDALNENNFYLDGRGLALQEGVSNRDGEPDGIPVNYSFITPWSTNTGDAPPPYVPENYGFISGSWGNPYNKGWYNFDSPEVIFDLNGSWNITSIWVYINTNMVQSLGYDLAQDSRKMDFKVSSNGTQWDVIGTIEASYGEQGWLKIDINPSLAVNAKYFTIGIKSYHLGSIAIYGVRSQAQEIKGLKLKRQTPTRDMKARIGVNGFLGEKNVDIMASLSSVTRWYNNANWNIEYPSWQQRNDDVQGIQANNLVFKYEESVDGWKMLDYLKNFKDAGVTNLFTLNNWSAYNTYKNYIPTVAEALEARPLDPEVERDNLTVSTIPSNYKFIARTWYNIAGKLGNNQDVDKTFMQLKPTESQEVGLNLVNYGEINNERDSIWAQTRWTNAEESAAIHSACYDGHKGQMGAGYGVKAADPSFQVLNAATVAPETAYFWKMMKWWDYHRGVGNYPLDVISYHHYVAFSDLPSTYGSANTWAIRPERDSQFDSHKGKLWDFPHFRDTYMPTKEMWLTETGYSEHYGGSCSPNYPTQVERSWYKACWTLRLLIMNMYVGADVINLFWYSNQDGARLVDLDPTVKNKAAFLTHGLTEGDTSANDWNRHYLTTGYYLASFRNEVNGYFLKHAVKLGLEDWTMENIIPTVDPTLYAFAAEKDDNEKGIFIWYSDMLMDKKTVRVILDESETMVEVISFEGADVRKDFKGLSTNVPAQASGNVRFIDIEVGECPVFVKTKNIGVEKLKPLEEIKIQSISQSAIKLAWRDNNVGNTHKTKIFVSEKANEGYTIVNNTVLTNGECTVSGLLANTNYFFRIQLEDGASQSEMTVTYGASTLGVVTVPTNFHSTNASTSTIDLAWEYLDEAKIDKFIIYRSLSLNGTFTKIATIDKGERIYTDSQLFPANNYYYKIVAALGVNILSQSAITNASTDTENSGEAPTILNAKTNFIGDIMYVRMSQPVKNVANNESAFLITDSDNVVNVVETRLAIGDETLVEVVINRVSQSANLKLNYDGIEGKICDKDTELKTVSVNDLAVTNNANSPSLLSKKVRLNFVNAGVGSSAVEIVHTGDTWNDIVIPAKDNESNQFQGSLVDVNGVATNWRFLLPFSDYPVFFNKWDSEGFPTFSHPTVSPINLDMFPYETRRSGAYIADWASKIAFNLSGLDTSKQYNMWFSVVPIEWETEASSTYNIESANGTKSATWNINKTDFNVGLIREMSPNVGTFQNLKPTAFEKNGAGFASTATPVNILPTDINLVLTNLTPAYRLAVTGMVIEEVIPLVI